MSRTPSLLVSSLLLQLVACGADSGEGKSSPTDPGDGSTPVDTATEPDPGPPLSAVTLSPTCVQLATEAGSLAATEDGRYALTGGTDAPPIWLQPAGLGRVLLYDAGRYVVGEDGVAVSAPALESDITTGVDHYVSAGEWLLWSADDGSGYRLQSRRHDTFLGADGQLVSGGEAAALTITDATGCATFPELTVNATGAVSKTTFDDGALYGLADAHSHILSNFGFGGGGLYHGGAFHPYGVEHALPDCDAVHGEDGRRDLFGFAYDEAGGDLDLTAVLVELGEGELSEFNHSTDGYPAFTEWPNSRKRATHQTQYYRWLERAWLGGLRLMVQHATSDETICKLTVGQGFQASRYDCSDMTAVDRIIDETYAMQDYIDALHGGEGEGWFRVVGSPAEAREVIEDGKLAIILGIETSNLFRCYLTERAGEPTCDEAYVDAQLDAYYARGVRALFPAHKYGNRFVPGDGSRDFIELGAFVNSGHWTNKTEDCPPLEWNMPTGFDGGSLSFAGLNQPRDAHVSPAPHDLSGFEADPLGTMLAFAPALLEGGASGSWCQNASLTPLGEHLLDGMMKRGMIIEVDHLPAWAYARAFEILHEHDYPAAGTHNRNWDDQLFALGGLSTIGLPRCQDADTPGTTTAGVADMVARIEAVGGYPGFAFSFDYNGFAGGPRPRFGEDGCSSEQPNPLTYPFASYAGDVTLEQPVAGERTIDFNTEGMVHIGLLPELMQDARADAISDAALEPWYRGAEAYVRMWEKAEARGAALSAE